MMLGSCERGNAFLGSKKHAEFFIMSAGKPEGKTALGTCRHGWETTPHTLFTKVALQT